jgi:acetyl-CoA carboxylase alpha subunit
MIACLGALQQYPARRMQTRHSICKVIERRLAAARAVAGSSAFWLSQVLCIAARLQLRRGVLVIGHDDGEVAKRLAQQRRERHRERRLPRERRYRPIDALRYGVVGHEQAPR